MEDRSEIAFFDLETTLPDPHDHSCAILEFGAILVCPRTLRELREYSTFVRPTNLSVLNSFSDRRNGITTDAIVSASTFEEIADNIYEILHGRIWGGHNIKEFDCELIREAFEEIGKPAPEPKDIYDTLDLLKEKFGRRAGNMKMASLASYFGLGEQTHRSLDDVKMNIEILRRCSAVLFLESSYPQFLDPNEVSITSIEASIRFLPQGPRIILLHKAIDLHLHCSCLKVRCGFNEKFRDLEGRPRLNFLVDAPPSLCKVLDACEDAVRLGSGHSEWKPVVNRKIEYLPTVRLRIPPAGNGDAGPYATEIYQKEQSGTKQKLVFIKFDAAELNTWFKPSTIVDARFSLEPYDYHECAGIQLVAKELIIHKE